MGTLLFSVTCLGLSSLMVQVLCLREFLAIFSGNELILGLVLGNWLLLTGLGTLLGRWSARLKQPMLWLLAGQLLIALLPPLQLTAIRLGRLFFLPGLVLGINTAFFLSLLVLLPYCLVSGFLLTLFVRLSAQGRPGQGRIGEIYALDVLGDILGGLLFAFVLVWLCTPFQITFLLLLLNLGAAWLLASGLPGARARSAVVGSALLALALFFSFSPEQASMERIYPGRIETQAWTPHGHILASREGGQVTIYRDGTPVASSHDPLGAEEAVHYGLSQVDEPAVVLMLGSGLNGALSQALQHEPVRIDYLELDRQVLDFVRQYETRAADKRLRLMAGDGRRFLADSQERYGAILVNLPDPANGQLNRFYTREFFQQVHQSLAKGGVFALRLSGPGNYASQEYRVLASSVFKTMESVFPHLLVVPGRDLYLLAADAPLDKRIHKLLAAKGIAPVAMNDAYLKATLSPDRLLMAEQAVSLEAPLNLDFTPVAYQAHLVYWLSEFRHLPIGPLLAVLLIVVAAVTLLRTSPRPAASFTIFSTGFCGMGLEVVVLLAFQVCHGYVYQQVGLLITAFLSGLALGAFWARRGGRAGRLLGSLDLALALGAFFLGFLLLAIRDAGILLAPSWTAPLFPLFLLLTGLGAGMQLPLAAARGFQKVEESASRLYGLDYLGGGLGALLVGCLIVPSMGLARTCFLLGSVKLISRAMLAREERTGHFQEEGDSQSVQVRRVAAFLVIAVFLGMGWLIISEQFLSPLYNFSFLPLYHSLVLLLLALGLIKALALDTEWQDSLAGGPWLKALERTFLARTGTSLLNWLAYPLLGLIAVFPLVRCYFKIPYLFCHVCPRLCVFGLMRPYLVPAALIMNLERRFWCHRLCPLGFLGRCQAGVTAFRREFPRGVVTFLGGCTVIASSYAYFKVKADFITEATLPGPWYSWLYKNLYSPTGAVLAVVGGFLVLAFVFKRPFCGMLCPIGGLSRILAQMERVVFRRDAETKLP